MIAQMRNILDCGTLMMMDSVDTQEQTRHSIMVRIDVRAPKVTKKVKLKVKADTGANANILPIRCLKQMYPEEEDPTTVLQSSLAILTTVNGSTLQQIGTLNLTTKFDDSGWVTCKFFDSDNEGPAILSCDASEKLGTCIVRVSNSKNISALKRTTPNPPIPDLTTLQKLYPDQFEGLGNLPGPYNYIRCLTVPPCRPEEVNIFSLVSRISALEKNDRDRRSMENIKPQRLQPSHPIVGEDAICDVFASKYEELYSSVSFNADDMVELRRDVDIDIRSKCCEELCYSNHAVTVKDIKEVLGKLKLSKSDADPDLSSDHFKRACPELYVHLFSSHIHVTTYNGSQSCTLFNNQAHSQKQEEIVKCVI
ncbi:hypothetical protein CAPTEDRAFT_203676 [Capitella teleta]|uniref:Uncharacterized protein n=1 Tax=Capitella teleta TaxID=283909 RepID=R7U5K2_CAPTE|nr:hypothetical protein CAPTEDRAFT_203676 [Capitella teleta]|eukprot:ELT98415.1 hypothetical protein CAPTEDRAFT_203676 [Capitella teleta]